MHELKMAEFKCKSDFSVVNIFGGTFILSNTQNANAI
jgi:hypothetical protein